MLSSKNSALAAELRGINSSLSNDFTNHSLRECTRINSAIVVYGGMRDAASVEQI